MNKMSAAPFPLDDADADASSRPFSSQEQQQEQQRQHAPSSNPNPLVKGFAVVGDTMAGFFTSMVVPQGLLAHRAMNNHSASDSEREAQEAANQSRDRHGAAYDTKTNMHKNRNKTNTKQQQAQRATAGIAPPPPFSAANDTNHHYQEQQRQQPPENRPRLMSNRETLTEESHVWNFVWSLIQTMTDFHQVWSYLLLFSLFLHPVSTIMACAMFGLFAIILFAVYDFIKCFFEGRDLTALAERYYDFAMNRWRRFKKGQGRRGVFIVTGIVLDPKTQKKIMEQVAIENMAGGGNELPQQHYDQPRRTKYHKS